jgi:RecG-like helicase
VKELRYLKGVGGKRADALKDAGIEGIDDLLSVMPFRWEDRRASIVVTPLTILIHKNSKVGLEVTPRTRRDVTIERDGRRVRVRVGKGRAEVLWSFEPPDGDAEGWTRDLRAAVQQIPQEHVP